MTWQRKHDIIIGWIVSCKTIEQLLSLIPFIKNQKFDYDNLLLMVRLQAASLYAGVVVNCLEKTRDILSR